LDRIGLHDVGLNLTNKIEYWIDGKLTSADGFYLRKAITLALDAQSPAKMLHHEALHAIRDMGLFTDGEWGILARAADKWRAQHNIDERYSGFSDEARTEEGVAHAYADWADGKPATKDGRIARLFRRIREFFERLRERAARQGLQVGRGRVPLNQGRRSRRAPT
jgi:hypothetical protein